MLQMLARLVTIAAAVTLGLACTGAAALPRDFLDATLPNGLRVVIVRSRIAPVAATVVTYLVGSRDDPPDVPGMAHAQEHMMFRGTRAISGPELGTIATALGGSFNAETTETTTQYSFAVPAADLDAVLRIEADRMRDVDDFQSQWVAERGAIEQEVAADEAAPGRDLFRDAAARAFRGTGYEHDGVGTAAAFDRLTGPRLKAFHRRWYAPNNALLVIAGDVDPDATLARVRARFGGLARRDVPAHAVAKLPELRRTVVRRTTTLIYPLAAVGYRFSGVAEPDFLPVFVLQAMLGADAGPLRALQDAGEVLAASWSSMPYVPEAQLGFAIAALPPNGDPASMTAELERIAAGWVKNGVPRDLFETTRRRLIAAQEQSRNSVAALASDWSDTIARDGEPSIVREQQLLAAVTLAQVNRAARTYLDPKQAYVAALKPSASASVAAAPAPPQGGRENPLDRRSAAAPLPAWAQYLVRDVTLPPSPLAPTTSRLANGLQVVVQPETISDAVFVFGRVRTRPALQEPAGKEGISSVLEAMFDAGSATLDRRALRTALDAIDSDLSSGADFGLETTAAGFERGVALLAEGELHPRFDDATFEFARRRASDALETSLNSSHALAVRRAEHELLPAGDPMLREPTLANLLALRLEDARDYYAHTFRPDLTTIVVVGNVTPARARAAIARAFGSWESEGPAPSLALPPIPPNAAGRVEITVPALRQADVTLTEALALNRNDPQLPALELGNAILGGGRLGPQQSRLFRDLRQNAGLVYSVQSQLDASDSRARFSIAFASLPANERRLETLVDAEIERMRSEPVAASELALMKASLIRSAILNDASTGSIGGTLLDAASTGRPLDGARLEAQHLLAVDAAAIERAFAEVIDPKRFVRTIEAP